jgi:hypothetical protein
MDETLEGHHEYAQYIVGVEVFDSARNAEQNCQRDGH